MSSASLEILDHLLDPVGECLTPDIARRIVNLRADAKTQARVEEFAEKNTEGTLTQEERETYEALVSAANMIAVLQAKARAVLRKAEQDEDG